jgi:hypothetical protein
MTPVQAAALRIEVESVYPALYQFLACYFHEDWLENVTTPEERLVGGPKPEPDVFKRAVRAYAVEAGEQGIKALAEIDRLLGSTSSGQELGKLLSRGFSVCYWPGSAEAYRPWLQEVRTTLSAELARAA